MRPPTMQTISSAYTSPDSPPPTRHLPNSSPVGATHWVALIPQFRIEPRTARFVEPPMRPPTMQTISSAYTSPDSPPPTRHLPNSSPVGATHWVALIPQFRIEPRTARFVEPPMRPPTMQTISSAYTSPDSPPPPKLATRRGDLLGRP